MEDIIKNLVDKRDAGTKDMAKKGPSCIKIWMQALIKIGLVWFIML